MFKKERFKNLKFISFLLGIFGFLNLGLWDLNMQRMFYGKILSIQSHVVHGYVGNRAAVFPLQVNLDPNEFYSDLDSNFSDSSCLVSKWTSSTRFNSPITRNTNISRANGSTLTSCLICSMGWGWIHCSTIAIYWQVGLEILNEFKAFVFYFFILGYVGDVTFLNKLADLIEELKKKNPNLIYRKFTNKWLNLFYWNTNILICYSLWSCPRRQWGAGKITLYLDLDWRS